MVLPPKIWLAAALLFAFGGGLLQADPVAPAVWPERPPVDPADTRIVGWATGYSDVYRGPQALFDPAKYGNADHGTPEQALDVANVTLTGVDPDTYPVISLGDGGWITLTFSVPIRDGFGPDLAVFENSFGSFLELAFVEVTSDWVHFVRFPAVSLTPTAGLHDNLTRDDFTVLDPNNLYNLAGKYRGGLGTPFDLAELAGQPNLDINQIVAIRIRDVVGSVDGFATFDSLGHKVKDPFPTVFPEGGFDLDAVAILYQIPEPSVTALLLVMSAASSFRWRRRPRALPPRRAGLTSADQAAAFTLVELLVTVAIIAILALLISSGMRTARSRGEAAACVSNLRQLVGANVAYASEHEGMFVPAQEPQNQVRWHGARSGTGAVFDGTKGPLSPYLGRDGRVKLCPALRHVLDGGKSFEDGAGGYGYNAAYIGGTVASTWVPERMANLARSSRTVMFTDTAFPRQGGLQEYAYSEPFFSEKPAGRFRNPLNASVHFRHGGLANVAWCDGHVTGEAPSKIDDTNLYGGDAAKWKIGWFGPSEKNGFWRPAED